MILMVLLKISVYGVEGAIVGLVNSLSVVTLVQVSVSKRFSSLVNRDTSISNQQYGDGQRAHEAK